MKPALRELAAAMNRSDPAAAFAFRLWDGEVIGYGDRPKTSLVIKSSKVLEELFTKGFLGFGEAYMSGDLEVEEDLQEMLRLGLIVRFDENAFSLKEKIRLLPFYLKTMATEAGSRKNIAHHYDLTPEFYSLFLDETLTYSCGYFANADDSLEQAQRRKYDHIARKLLLGSGDTLVDIGCGWGGMLLHSALHYGAAGVGVTLSSNQHQYGCRRIEELGLGQRVEVKLQDYRQLTGTFDKFVSIGMFEHVGKRFIPVFMRRVAGLLRKGGTGLLHTISKEVESATDAWMRRYIFPGGYIPSLPETIREMGRAGLCVVDIEALRMHYARTLDCWISNFERNISRIQQLFDERFIRMWRLYLNACSASFKYGGIRIYQILFTNGLNNDLPMTREYVYRSIQPKAEDENPPQTQVVDRPGRRRRGTRPRTGDSKPKTKN
ncbi:MAG TPA: cyclopropane-fatty-acyl-phospholipid synthase family protein [Syntrophobacteraceae bacterium]|nr:cyclopropane-fatty-acyl-phospholipid synthase family protein [Syntrophobacteraceae bacterium]